MADLVVFPREVIEALRHVTTKSLDRKHRRDGVDFLDGERRGFFASGEIVLENEFTVSDADTFRVLGLWGDVGDLVRQDAAGGIFHGDALEQRAGQRGVHLRPRHDDGFGGTSDGEVVRDGDEHLLGGSQCRNRSQSGESVEHGAEFHGD